MLPKKLLPKIPPAYRPRKRKGLDYIWSPLAKWNMGGKARGFSVTWWFMLPQFPVCVDNLHMLHFPQTLTQNKKIQQSSAFHYVIILSECAPSKIWHRLSKTMHCAASFRKKGKTLAPSPCMHSTSIWGDGQFCLHKEFSKNGPHTSKRL